MGLRINTNVTSIVSQRNLSTSTQNQSAALAKLSSGERIVKAADDAAGLAISEKLKAALRGLGQANRNANDGVSMIQTAEGGLSEVSNILVRLRELSVQAASDTIGQVERQFVDLEYQALKDEIRRISQVTTFNGKKLLAGEGETLEIQIGINNDPSNDRLRYEPRKNNVGIEELGIAETNVKEKESAQKNLAGIDNAIQNVSRNRAILGSLQNRLASTITNLNVTQENLAAANSRIRDADVAVQVSELTKQSILNQAGISVLAQANQSQMSALKLLS